jgi:hypothetical protein
MSTIHAAASMPRVPCCHCQYKRRVKGWLDSYNVLHETVIVEFAKDWENLPDWSKYLFGTVCHHLQTIHDVINDSKFVAEQEADVETALKREARSLKTATEEIRLKSVHFCNSMSSDRIERLIELSRMVSYMAAGYANMDALVCSSFLSQGGERDIRDNPIPHVSQM